MLVPQAVQARLPVQREVQVLIPIHGPVVMVTASRFATAVEVAGYRRFHPKVRCMSASVLTLSKPTARFPRFSTGLCRCLHKEAMKPGGLVVHCLGCSVSSHRSPMSVGCSIITVHRIKPTTLQMLRSERRMAAVSLFAKFVS